MFNQVGGQLCQPLIDENTSSYTKSWLFLLLVSNLLLTDRTIGRQIIVNLDLNVKKARPPKKKSIWPRWGIPWNTRLALIYFLAIYQENKNAEIQGLTNGSVTKGIATYNVANDRFDFNTQCLTKNGMSLLIQWAYDSVYILYSKIKKIINSMCFSLSSV